MEINYKLRAIDDYIHFYNYERLQGKLKGLSPMKIRTKAVSQLLNCLLDVVQFTSVG
ncbi:MULTISPECIES: IS3 family transposase [Paenibacillus]|uniref:IS3 family transposase n=1 Tax=Paenibacillus albilobatus TaxID=2716884 RepID=UPI00135C481E